MTIKPLTRVEGHGQIEIFANQKEVSRVNFSMLDYRGIEKILIGKKYSEIPRLISKICGFCSMAHIVASCKAFETILDIQPSYTSTLLRQLMMMGETITSHAIHFFYMALPDLLKLATTTGVCDASINQSEIFEKASRLIKTGKSLVEIVGGRAVQPVSVIIGGVAKNLTEKEKTLLQKNLKSSIAATKWCLNIAQDLLEKSDVTRNVFELHDPLYMGLQKDGSFNLYEGSFKITNDDRDILAIFDANDYNKFIIENRVNYDRFIPSRVQKKEQNLLVGPLARYHVVNEYGIYEVHEIFKNFQEWHKNIIFSNVLRLIEILVCLYKSLIILDNVEITKEQPIFFTSPKVKYNSAFSAVEAPRGTLAHYYHLNKDMVVDDAKICVPTELNTFSIHEILNRTCREEFNKHRSIDLVQETAKVIIRSFDPCISCSSVTRRKPFLSS